MKHSVLNIAPGARDGLEPKCWPHLDRPAISPPLFDPNWGRGLKSCCNSTNLGWP